MSPVFLGIISPPSRIPVLSYLLHPGDWLAGVYWLLLLWAVVTIAIEVFSAKPTETVQEAEDPETPGERR